MLGQPDALQPDDQDELEPAAAHRRQERREVPGGERPDPEQVEVEHRLLDALLDQAEHGENRLPPIIVVSTNGDVHPIVWPP